MTARTKAGAKAKGARFENEIARQCKAAFPGADVWTGRQRKQGHGLPDVAVDGFGQENSGWLHLECKNQDRVSWLGALRQAIRDSGEKGRIPIAVIKDARCKRGRRVPVVAVMGWDDYDEIRRMYGIEFARVLNVPGETHVDERKRPCWEPATDEPTGGVFALATDPPVAAFGWLWLRDEVLAPLWRAGNAGKGATP